ncbi:hypothetical protein COOONC_11540 [Cooperia oncophora]
MMILSSFIHYQPLKYQDYAFSPLANTLGIFFALSAASAIPIVGIFKCFHSKGNTIGEKLRRVVMPYRRRSSQHEYVPIGRRHSSDVML